MNINERYRRTLTRDGRVIWWEHVFVFLSPILAAGLWLAHYLRSLIPILPAIFLGIALGLWSYQQDKIVHSTNDAPERDQKREGSKRNNILDGGYGGDGRIHILAYLHHGCCMSTSIHRAIGYAMSWRDFHETTLLDIDQTECLGDELDRLLGGYRNLRYGGDDSLWGLIDDGAVTECHSTADLIMTVGCGDDQDHVLFFPNEALKKKWHRFNDAMDWVFACNLQGNYPEAIIEYTETSHPPFHRSWMKKTGEPVGAVSVDNFLSIIGPDIVAGVPDVLRWWLIHCGVFDLAGVGRLRPMRALWWR